MTSTGKEDQSDKKQPLAFTLNSSASFLQKSASSTAATSAPLLNIFSKSTIPAAPATTSSLFGGTMSGIPQKSASITTTSATTAPLVANMFSKSTGSAAPAISPSLFIGASAGISLKSTATSTSTSTSSSSTPSANVFSKPTTTATSLSSSSLSSSSLSSSSSSSTPSANILSKPTTTVAPAVAPALASSLVFTGTSANILPKSTSVTATTASMTPSKPTNASTTTSSSSSSSSSKEQNKTTCLVIILHHADYTPPTGIDKEEKVEKVEEQSHAIALEFFYFKGDIQSFLEDTAAVDHKLKMKESNYCIICDLSSDKAWKGVNKEKKEFLLHRVNANKKDGIPKLKDLITVLKAENKFETLKKGGDHEFLKQLKDFMNPTSTARSDAKYFFRGFVDKGREGWGGGGSFTQVICFDSASDRSCSCFLEVERTFFALPSSSPDEYYKDVKCFLRIQRDAFDRSGDSSSNSGSSSVHRDRSSISNSSNNSNNSISSSGSGNIGDDNSVIFELSGGQYGSMYDNVALSSDGKVILLYSNKQVYLSLIYVDVLDRKILTSVEPVRLEECCLKIKLQKPGTSGGLGDCFIAKASFHPYYKNHIVVLLDKQGLFLYRYDDDSRKIVFSNLKPKKVENLKYIEVKDLAVSDSNATEFVTFTYGPSIGWLYFSLFIVVKVTNDENVKSCRIYSLCPVLPRACNLNDILDNCRVSGDKVDKRIDRKTKYLKSLEDVKDWLSYFDNPKDKSFWDNLRKIVGKLPNFSSSSHMARTIVASTKDDCSISDADFDTYLSSGPGNFINVQKIELDSRHTSMMLSHISFVDRFINSDGADSEGFDALPFFYSVESGTGNACISYLDLHAPTRGSGASARVDGSSKASNKLDREGGICPSQNDNSDVVFEEVILERNINPSLHSEPQLSSSTGGSLQSSSVSPNKPAITRNEPVFVRIIADDSKAEIFYLIRQFQDSKILISMHCIKWLDKLLTHDFNAEVSGVISRDGGPFKCLCLPSFDLRSECPPQSWSTMRTFVKNRIKSLNNQNPMIESDIFDMRKDILYEKNEGEGGGDDDNSTVFWEQRREKCKDRAKLLLDRLYSKKDKDELFTYNDRELEEINEQLKKMAKYLISYEPSTNHKSSTTGADAALSANKPRLTNLASSPRSINTAPAPALATATVSAPPLAPAPVTSSLLGYGSSAGPSPKSASTVTLPPTSNLFSKPATPSISPFSLSSSSLPSASSSFGAQSLPAATSLAAVYAPISAPIEKKSAFSFAGIGLKAKSDNAQTLNNSANSLIQDPKTNASEVGSSTSAGPSSSGSNNNVAISTSEAQAKVESTAEVVKEAHAEQASEAKVADTQPSNSTSYDISEEPNVDKNSKVAFPSNSDDSSDDDGLENTRQNAFLEAHAKGVKAAEIAKSQIDSNTSSHNASQQESAHVAKVDTASPYSEVSSDDDGLENTRKNAYEANAKVASKDDVFIAQPSLIAAHNDNASQEPNKCTATGDSASNIDKEDVDVDDDSVVGAVSSSDDSDDDGRRGSSAVNKNIIIENQTEDRTTRSHKPATLPDDAGDNL